MSKHFKGKNKINWVRNGVQNKSGFFIMESNPHHLRCEQFTSSKHCTYSSPRSIILRFKFIQLHISPFHKIIICLLVYITYLQNTNSFASINWNLIHGFWIVNNVLLLTDALQTMTLHILYIKFQQNHLSHAGIHFKLNLINEIIIIQ